MPDSDAIRHEVDSLRAAVRARRAEMAAQASNAEDGLKSEALRAERDMLRAELEALGGAPARATQVVQDDPPQVAAKDTNKDKE
jgi:hypothetical protein